MINGNCEGTETDAASACKSSPHKGAGVSRKNQLTSSASALERNHDGCSLDPVSVYHVGMTVLDPRCVVGRTYKCPSSPHATSKDSCM